jgi:hypothetical protein
MKVLTVSTALLNMKERKCQSAATIYIYIYNDNFHMATCFNSQGVIFRPFELIALTKQLL